MGASLKTIPYLNGWRGLAIVLVLQSHFGMGGGGRFGVALFFALSGYLMGELLFVRNVSLPQFFQRRISRIMPTCWLYVLVAFVVAALYQAHPYTAPGREVAMTLFFARTYFPADVSIWAERWPIGHFWSLNVEEHSYLVLAMLALAGRWRAGRLRIGMLVMATAVCLMFNCYYMVHAPGGASPWFARSECAALGLVAAAALRALRHRTAQPLIRDGAAAIAPTTLVLGMFCFSWPAYPVLAITLGPLLLAVSVNYLASSPATLRLALSARILRWFGTCSFSLYIWQQLFYAAYQNGTLQRQVAGVLALLVGTLAFYVYESPLRRWLNSRRSVITEVDTVSVLADGTADVADVQPVMPELAARV